MQSYRFRRIRRLSLVAALLCLAVLPGRPASASEAVLEAEPVDVADSARFFHAKAIDPAIAFPTTDVVHIQGVKVEVPKPEGLAVSYRNLPDKSGNPVDFVYFRKGDEMILECSFKPRQLRDAKGEPFTGNRAAMAATVEENRALRESAENIGDKDKLAKLLIMAIVQNTANSILVEARTESYQAEPKGASSSLFEGHIVLASSSIPVAALAHRNQAGIDAGALYLTWLNKLLEMNRR